MLPRGNKDGEKIETILMEAVMQTALLGVRCCVKHVRESTVSVWYTVAPSVVIELRRYVVSWLF